MHAALSFPIRATFAVYFAKRGGKGGNRDKMVEYVTTPRPTHIYGGRHGGGADASLLRLILLLISHLFVTDDGAPREGECST